MRKISSTYNHRDLSSKTRSKSHLWSQLLFKHTSLIFKCLMERNCSIDCWYHVITRDGLLSFTGWSTSQWSWSSRDVRCLCRALNAMKSDGRKQKREKTCRFVDLFITMTHSLRVCSHRSFAIQTFHFNASDSCLRTAADKITPMFEWKRAKWREKKNRRNRNEINVF